MYIRACACVRVCVLYIPLVQCIVLRNSYQCGERAQEDIIRNSGYIYVLCVYCTYQFVRTVHSRRHMYIVYIHSPPRASSHSILSCVHICIPMYICVCGVCGWMGVRVGVGACGSGNDDFTMDRYILYTHSIHMCVYRSTSFVFI